MEKVDISIIVPVYNEKDSIAPLYESIKKTILPLGKTYEVIFIDDGSSDNSLEVLEELYLQNKHNIKVVSFRGNHGKSAALSCGMKEAQGDVIITMDADMQNDPRDIPNMLSKLNEGYGLVSGWRRERKDPFSKIFFSKIFNIVTSMVSGIKMHDFNCGLKAYKKEAAKDLKIYGDLHRYLPVLLHSKNYRVGEIEVTHHAREHGKTKYGTERIMGGFLDLLTVVLFTRYSEKPSRFFGGAGIFISSSGFFVLAYLIIGHFIYLLNGNKEFEIRERPLFTIAVLSILVGFQLLSTGLIAEMINMGAKGKKEKFEINKTLGCR